MDRSLTRGTETATAYNVWFSPSEHNWKRVWGLTRDARQITFEISLREVGAILDSDGI